MTIPEQSPNYFEILSERSSSVFGCAGDPRYTATLGELAAGHRHWEKVKFIGRDRGLDPESLWALLKMGREVHYKRTPFCGADGTRVRYMIPDAVVRELHLLDQEASGRVAVDGDGRIPAGAQRERFIIRALTEEAIASSLLEGAATTRLEAKQMLRSGRSPRTIGERMVANNYRAILFIREHTDTPLSPEFLLTLQKMLTEGTLKDEGQSGRFRRAIEPVRIEDHKGETVYVPPPAEELGSRIETLCAFANQTESDQDFIHPVIRACLLHFQLAVDHPFCDGNGRTARAVFYWYLLRHRYWLFEFMPISTLIRKSPAQYARSFLYAETDEYDATYFLMYQSRIFAMARKAMNEYVARKLEEQRRAAALVNADEDLNLRQRQVLQQFARNHEQQTGIEMHANDFRVSYQTARNDLLDLRRRGYLTHYKDGKTYIFVRGKRLDEIGDDD